MLIRTTERVTREQILPTLRSIPRSEWCDLAVRVAEPNGYYLADWKLAVDASARGRTGISALCAWNAERRLIGILPVISAWRAWNIPLPAVVSADPYGDLGTPLIDRDRPLQAVRLLMQHARRSGARAIVLRHFPLQGPVSEALSAILGEQGLAPYALRTDARACLDATRDAEELLRDALGAKKLKELRRQRNRLAEHGAVTFAIARSPDEVARAVEDFLAIEASGWKANRGTALAQDEGDAKFVRQATVALAGTRQCEIAMLRAGTTTVATGVVLRHQDRAFWFKLGVDPRFAKCSPGVQLALELTRHLCADPGIAFADSTAVPGHPMIDPIWRGRLAIGDLLIPLRRGDPIVPLLVATLKARSFARDIARRLIQPLRTLKEKRQ